MQKIHVISLLAFLCTPLTASYGAQEAKDRSLFYRKRDVVDCGNITKSLRKRFRLNRVYGHIPTFRTVAPMPALI